MAEIKTKQTDADVREFIESFANTEQKKQDSFELVKLMQDLLVTNRRCGGRRLSGLVNTIINPNEAARKGIGHL